MIGAFGEKRLCSSFSFIALQEQSLLGRKAGVVGWAPYSEIGFEVLKH